MGSIWEIDFYSRPIVDEKQKKIWEVLICEAPTNIRKNINSLFRYSQYCPSTEVNSVWLKTAITEAITKAPEAPIKIRFFRRQVNNMITKTCQDLGIPAQASRRTFFLYKWLEERMKEVYPQETGYTGQTNSSFTLESPLAQRLPDALEGERWQFVSLSVEELGEMPEWDICFGESFPLDIVKIAPKNFIPGILVFSPRALPLAAWMSGLELAWLRFDDSQGGRLVLEAGASESWILVGLRNPQVLANARAFESAKKNANGVHFIAVQSDPQAKSFAGFWLLCEVKLF